MTQALDNQVALVTGASRGTGRAIALELARQGMAVVGTATSETGAQAITAYFAEADVRGRGVMLNVNDAARGEAVIEKTTKTHGGPNILVNNVGIMQDNLVMRMKDNEWVPVTDTNLSAVFRLSRAVLRPTMKTRGGRIINITSAVDSAGNPGRASYAATKAGVEGMSRALVREIGSRNITVNCIAPGFIDTNMTKVLSEEQHTALKAQIPLGRLSAPKDTASAVAFLASPAADYITGSTLHVSSSIYMR